MILHITGLVLGILLDQIVGDPHFLPHPVRAVGKLISFLESKLLGSENEDMGRDQKRNSFPESKLLESEKENTGRDQKKERKRGALLWFIVIISTMAVTCAAAVTAYKVNTFLGILTEAVLTSYILAARSLYRESMAVYHKLQDDDTEGARYALSMIVGRDTESLNDEEIIKAAVETVAENTSDGVIAPLLYTAIGGPVLGMMYKAVNTMDSMLGYHNQRYEYFGSFAARADDFFNYIPSRISALFMAAGCAVLSLFSKQFSWRNAFRIWKRDRKNHKSPNSAETESVCAGALGLRLGGTHLYKGIPVEKPTIGDELRKPDVQDIKRANMLMFMTEALVSVAVILILILTLNLP